jgi:hypothetical protein
MSNKLGKRNLRIQQKNANLLLISTNIIKI